MATKRVTDERRETMSDRAARCYALHMETPDVSIDNVYPDLLHDYTTDVDDLLHDYAELEAEIAAMRPVVEALADEMAVYWNRDVHRFCCYRCDAPPTLHVCQIAHTPNCRYEQARAFVAAHPAPSTAAASEAESEGE